MELTQRIHDRKARVTVVGLGYVGLPVALSVTSVGFEVTGIDIDPEKVEGINRGASPLTDVSDEDLQSVIDSGKFRATTDRSSSQSADVIVVCVPTPLKDDLPDMRHIESAGKAIAENLRPGQLVILESTTYPGTTEEFLRQILETSGLKAGQDFYLGFSPERIDPGNERFGLADVPKIVGGIDENSSELMEAFYRTFIRKVVRVSSPRTAEMAKLLENTYRHVNIALVNEIAILCNDLGIDVWEVIDAASTKPFGFQPFYPGPGWGGHCIPVDPAYLSWRVRQMGETARFVELAREVNEHMPGYVVQRIAECLNEETKSLRGSSVLILGITYKPDVADVRESPALDILARLQKAGAVVSFHDPFIADIDVGGSKLNRVELSDATISGHDVVVVITNHSSYDWDKIAEKARLVFDTRNALKGLQGRIVRL